MSKYYDVDVTKGRNQKTHGACKADDLKPLMGT